MSRSKRAVIHESAAQGFARAPEDYERGRPSYPHEAIGCLAKVLAVAPGRRVLDLAAGTGKLTRALAPMGAELIAVEPVEPMRAKIAETLPQAEILAGTAEAIPLQDASVDAVAVGQAFHWFSGGEALAEIHRVLRPGGRLGLIWNARDEGTPWVEDLTEIMEPYRGDAPAWHSYAWRAAFERTTLFTPLEHAEFRLEHELDVAGIVARVTSVSFIAALPEDERAAVEARVRELLASDPTTCGRERIVVPYRTHVYWCERR